MARFIVHSDKHGEFRWKFVGSNNQVIGKSGDGFKKQEDCIASLNLLQADVGAAALDFQLRNGIRPVTPARANAATAPAFVPAPVTPVVAAAPVVAQAQAAPVATSAPGHASAPAGAVDAAVAGSPAIAPSQAFTSQV
jgi:uncharacterized protein YegP (UPF0339 family)